MGLMALFALLPESCDFKEATDNIIDAVAVQVWAAAHCPCLQLVLAASSNPAGLAPLQYGHVIWSLLHGAGFGVYFKGGSAHMILNGNRVFDTGEGGLAFSAGFDTGEWLLGARPLFGRTPG